METGVNITIMWCKFTDKTKFVARELIPVVGTKFPVTLGLRIELDGVGEKGNGVMKENGRGVS